MKKRLIAMLLAVLLMMPTLAVANDEADIAITVQPGNIEAPLDTTGFARVEAEAEGEITYRWYWWDAEQEAWTDAGELDENDELVHEWEGYDADTLYVPVTEESIGQQFFCLLTNEDGDSVESDVVTVGEGLTSEIELLTQPEDIYAPSGETGTASVEISVESEPIPATDEFPEIERETLVSYKWLYWDADAEEWQAADYDGSDTDTVAVPVSADIEGQQLKCLVRTADGAEAETDAITVYLTETPEEEPVEPTEPEQEPAEITIVTQPADIIAEIGKTGTATVVAESDAELSYQWYFRRGSSAWQPSGFTGNKTDTIKVPVTAARIGQQYKCVITTDDGGEVETNAVTVYDRVPAGIMIVTEPTDIRARLGQTGTATVEAVSDAELSYQWYFRKGDSAWQTSGFDGNKTATITVPVASARIGQQYKCVITNADGIKVETVAVTVLEAEPAEITILTQPADIQAKLGELGTATVVAESDAKLSYRWYFKTKNGSTWQASGFAGNKTDTISVPVETARIGQQYKCVVTNADGVSVETDAVTVLAPLPSEITINSQPGDMYGAIGDTVTATVSASADTSAALRYQWYFRRGSSAWQVSGMTGNKTATISVPVTAARIGQQYKCVITTADGGSAETAAVTILNNAGYDLSVTRNPDSYRAYEGVPVELDVSASLSEGVTYQWYKDGEPIEGATGSRVYFPAVTLENAGEYYCVVTAYGKTETSKTAVVVVYP